MDRPSSPSSTQYGHQKGTKWLFPAATPQPKVYSGINSLQDQLLNTSWSSLTPLGLKLPELQVCPLTSTLNGTKRRTVWICRSPLWKWQTLLCTTVPWSPQWQETLTACTKTWTHDCVHESTSEESWCLYFCLSTTTLSAVLCDSGQDYCEGPSTQASGQKVWKK